jgi:hypothetical protein
MQHMKQQGLHGDPVLHGGCTAWYGTHTYSAVVQLEAHSQPRHGITMSFAKLSVASLQQPTTQSVASNKE